MTAPELSDFLKISIAISSIVGVLICAAIIFCIRAICYRRKKEGWHALDADEEEFKNYLESDNTNIDDLFNFDEGFENTDVQFEKAELEQLKLLDNYRQAFENTSDTKEERKETISAMVQTLKSPQPQDVTPSKPIEEQ
eukprot:g4663.t1